MLQLWSLNYICQVCKLFFYFGHVRILDNIYIWVILVNSKSVLLLAFVKYMLYMFHFTSFGTFWRLKILVLLWKIVQNLLIFVYLFWPKNSTIAFTKTFLTQEWWVVESYPTPCWIAFLMFYRLVYNIRSHFNEPILAWSPYLNNNCLFSWAFTLVLCY